MVAKVDLENAQLAPRNGYGEVLKQIIDEGHCPFCREHFQRHHPNSIIEDGDHWIVTTNGWPYKGVRLQFLLISRQHVERIEDLPADARLAFFEAFDRIVKSHELRGATLLWRSGDTDMTGASVAHLHAQIIVGHPRSETGANITGLVGFGPQE